MLEYKEPFAPSHHLSPKSTPQSHSSFSDSCKPGSVPGKGDLASQAPGCCAEPPGLSGATGLSRVKQLSKKANLICPEACCPQPGCDLSGPGYPVSPGSLVPREAAAASPMLPTPPSPTCTLIPPGSVPGTGCPQMSLPAPCPPDIRAVLRPSLPPVPLGVTPG